MSPYNLDHLTHVGVGETESLQKLLDSLVEMGWLEQADELLSIINHLHAYADCYISGVKKERASTAIRHTRVFETAGQQITVSLCEVPCTCKQPNCCGLTIGFNVQTMMRYPQGMGLLFINSDLHVSMEAKLRILDALQQQHARELLELLQSTVHGLTKPDELQRQLGAFFFSFKDQINADSGR